jgi:hypothetical protein
MRYVLIVFVFMLTACGTPPQAEEKNSYAQYLIDSREYLSAIDYLESRPSSASNRKLLADAYIGASGFELLPFLTQINNVPVFERREDEHIFEYINTLLSSFNMFTKLKLDYLESALKILINNIDLYKENTQEKFKVGIVYIYKIIGSVKAIGEYAQKIQIDPVNGKVVILSDEEKLDLFTQFNNVIKFSLNAYLNLRSSYRYLKGYFISIDKTLSELLGTTIDELEGNFDKVSYQQLIAELIKKNPHVRDKLFKIIDSECNKQSIKENLLAAIEMIKDYTQFIELQRTIKRLLVELEKQSGKVCSENTY